MKRGLNISMPVLHSSIYDCIVDTGKKLVKVQVKSTKKQPLLIEGQTNRKQNNVQINIENYKQCLVCDKLSEKDFCSNDCKSAFLR